MAHRCAGVTRRVIELHEMSALLDMPYRWLEDSYGHRKLLRIQEDVEAMEKQLLSENRCLDCGGRQ